MYSYSVRRIVFDPFSVLVRKQDYSFVLIVNFCTFLETGLVIMLSRLI